MTGIKQFNFPAFFTAEEIMQRAAWPTQSIINPARMEQEDGLDVTDMTGDPAELEDCFDLREAMTRNCAEICNCTHIYMLKGWANSKGANAEHALACSLGLTIRYQ